MFSKISPIVFILTTLFLSNFSKCGVLEDILLESACAGNTEIIEELFALGIKIEINTDQKEGKNLLKAHALFKTSLLSSAKTPSFRKPFALTCPTITIT